MKLNQCCCFTPKLEASSFSSPRGKRQQPSRRKQKPVLDPVRKGVLEQHLQALRWMIWGWGREAKLKNLGSQAASMFLRLWGLQSTSGYRPESVAEFGESLWAGKDGSDPEHGTSPADGGHGPSCTQAVPVAGERSLWIGGATGKGKPSIPVLSCQWSTLGRSGATCTESLHVSKLYWPFSLSPLPMGSGAGLNSCQHSSLAQSR